MKFKIKTGNNETMKLLRSTKSKINKDNYVENVPHLEILVILMMRIIFHTNCY